VGRGSGPRTGAGSYDLFADDFSSRAERSCRSTGRRADWPVAEVGMVVGMVTVIGEFLRDVERGCNER
jgi:hypothetical protein